MEPYPSRRPLAGRYGGASSSASPGPEPYGHGAGRYSVASGVTSPIIVNGRGGSPISSPSATLGSSRLSSSSSSGPGSNGSTIAKRPYEGQKSGSTSATAAGGGGGLSLRDLSSPTLTSSNRCVRFKINGCLKIHHLIYYLYGDFVFKIGYFNSNL